MLEDSQGLKITSGSPEAVAHINAFIQQALGYGAQAETVIQAAILADPCCAIAYAYMASYHLSQESAVGQRTAHPYLQRAQQLQAHITLREQLYIDAISAWSAGKITEAIALQEEIVDRYPTDLMAVQQAQYHYFYLGDKQGLQRVAQKALQTNSKNHYLLGMLAFGLEQCHQLEQAEILGRQALALNRNDPWAQHAVAHVMETQGRIAEGIDWLESFADTWEVCNSMLYTHNWWHVALYYQQQGKTKKVLELYDQRVWGGARRTSPKDQVGAISLLMRLELAGVEIRPRWQDLAAAVQERIHEHALPFQDLHYVYTLARSGKNYAVKEMLQSMKAHAAKASPQEQLVWQEVILPAAEGLVGHAIGNQIQAAQLKTVLPKLWMIGGSHTQRELFKQIALSSAPMLRVSSMDKARGEAMGKSIGKSIRLLAKDAAFVYQAS